MEVFFGSPFITIIVFHKGKYADLHIRDRDDCGGSLSPTGSGRTLIVRRPKYLKPKLK